ncbi:MAG: hypothetical protein KA053_08360 [Lentimicrobiaceae bacterium]|nr:hypothetical protein [Lentimicrobiaceae bacterium]
MESRTRFIQSLFTSILAVWMVAASGGLSLYHHLCQCTGDDRITLTEVHACQCNHDAANDASSTPACCHNSQTEHACPVGAKDHCCSASLLYVVKTDQYVTSQYSQQEYDPEMAIAEVPWETILTENLPDADRLRYIPAEPPPPTRKTCLTCIGAFHSSLSV